MATPKHSLFYDTSGIANILKKLSGYGVHIILVGDSKTYGDNANRYYSALYREFGARTIPFRGCVFPAFSGVNDSFGRTWAGSSNQASALLDARPGQDLTASGGAGTFTRFETVTQTGSGATGIFISESGGIVKVWNQGHSTPFNGSGGITGGSSGATRNVSGVATATTIASGLSATQIFRPKLLQVATGNIAVSGIIADSRIESTPPSWGQGFDWTTEALKGRALAWGNGAGCFTQIKARTYRNTTSQVQSSDVNLATAGGFSSQLLDIPANALVPVKVQWQASGGTFDETGQYGLFFGALIYDAALKGLSCDYLAVGGAGIEHFLDTTYMTQALLTTYLSLMVPPTTDFIIPIIDFGQNNAAMSQGDFETNLNSIITLFNAAKPAGMRTKFILRAPYNTGSAHLAQKRDACFNVAEANKSSTVFENSYDKYTASYVAANTTDGIHPTLAFSQRLFADIVDGINNPVISAALGRSRSIRRKR